MIVGVDARAAAEEPGGKGRYVRELIRHLAELVPPERLLPYARERWDGDAAGALRWRLVERSGLAWHLAAGRLATRECDVYLATTSYLSPLAVRIPCVLVVHDLTAFQRRWRPELRVAMIERLALRPAARRARAIIADSQQTREDLAARVRGAGAKAVVIPLAAGEQFFPAAGDRAVLSRHGLERPYVLAVGALEPRKNIPRLLRAFETLPPPLRDDYELVLAGRSGRDGSEALASRNGRVRVLGEVPDADLPALYQGADVFCYPSLYEGFGLPPLEAMRCGTAVIASHAASLPEVGADAVRYIDPLAVEDIAAALRELLGDPRRRAELAARGQRRASAFSWASTAGQTLEVLEEAATP